MKALQLVRQVKDLPLHWEWDLLLQSSLVLRWEMGLPPKGSLLLRQVSGLQFRPMPDSLLLLLKERGDR
ncbi:hypothetical protein D3C81_2073360 [compost metagenome]